MADILDYAFMFWIALTGAVYVVGLIYEQKQLLKAKEELKLLAKKKREAQLERDRNWSSNQQTASSRSPQDYSYSSQQQFSAQQSSPEYRSQQSASSFGYQNEPLASAYHQQSVAASQLPNKDANNQWQRTYPHNQEATSYLSQEYDNQRSNNDNNQKQQQDCSYYADGSIPTATGFSADCVEWVNSILFLFYSQADKYGPIIMESVIRSLNEKLANILSSSEEHSSLLIEFSTINRQLSSRPELTNIRTESESEKSVSAACKVYNQRLVLDLAIQKSSKLNASSATYGSLPSTSGDEPQAAYYELTLENLEAKLKSVAMLNDKLIVVQFMEKPESKILLRRKFNQNMGQSRYMNETPIINEDSLVSLVLQTLTQIVVDLYFGDDPDFPQFRQHSATSGYRNRLNQLKGSANEIKRQIKHDFFGALSSSSGDKERKVSIKILSAKNINYNQNVTCLLELDAPYQQALSSTKQVSSNPYWEEHFLFNVSDKSQELVVELWDSITAPKESGTSGFGSLKRAAKLGAGSEQSTGSGAKRWPKQEVVAGAKFLGLVRISVDELRRNPMQKVSLMLQPQTGAETRPEVGINPLTSGDLSNSVGGELQVELMFLEHSSTANSSRNELAAAAGAGSSGLHKSHSLSSISVQQGDIVSVDRKLTPSGYVITTTTITKSKDKQQQLRQAQKEQSRLDRLAVRNQSPVSSATEQSELESTNLDGISSFGAEASGRASPNIEPSDGDRQRPRRSRSRSRSFLRAIKKRFSFSRSRSVGAGSRRNSQSALGVSNLDSGSMDSRSRASSVGSAAPGGGTRAKSVPASRDPSEVPTIVINRGGRLSDTASAFTFTHPRSQLVIECREPGGLAPDGSGNQKREQVRYYAISDEAALRGKWRRKGTKLHLFNEHQFVACHLAGSSTCHLCGRVFSRRPGKQGYKCRNCHLLSHKQCHVKVDHQCPYATNEGLKLEYIDADPPARLLEMAQRGGQSSESLPRGGMQQRSGQRPNISAKSISMDVDDR